MRSIAAGALASVLLGGCLKPAVNRCDNGAICKQGQACTERLDPNPVCGDPDEVAACFGLPNRTGCTHVDATAGSCHENLCSACDANWVECRYRVWTAMAVPTANAIHALAVVAPNDVYAITDKELLHYDGTSWSVRETSATGGLKSIWAADATNLFLTDTTSHIFHNDTVTLESSVPNGARLNRIWGTDLDHIIAAGSSETIAERNNGTWTFDQPPSPVTSFNDIWGLRTVGFAVGAGLIKKGQGTSWTVVQPTSGMPVSTDIISGVWGTSETDVYVVGRDQAGGGVAYHYDGTTFSRVQLPASTQPLAKIWGSAADSIYAVGSGGTIIHYDGTTWSSTPNLDTSVGLETVAGTGHDVFVAGAKGAIWKLSEP